MNIFIRTSIAPYRIDLYNALSREGHFRMCFYRRVAKDQAFDPEWLESLCEFTPDYLGGIELGRPSRKLCTGIFRRIREEKPDVVIVPEFQMVLFQVLFARMFSRKKFKVISMCDDSLDMISSRRDFTFLHRWLRSWVPRLVDDIITVTPPVCEWYQEHFGKGIWLPIIRSDRQMRETLQRVLPQSEALVREYDLTGKKVVGFVGRLVDIKNVDLVIRTFSEAGDKNCVLVIIGDGPERSTLEKMAESLNRDVIFTGRLEGDALYAWYNIIGVFTLLSSLEPFGAVVNEALLGGARVLVSSRAGASCLVNGDNGTVVDIDDADGLPGAMNDLLRSTDPTPWVPVLRQDRMTVLFDEMIGSLIAGIK